MTAMATSVLKEALTLDPVERAELIERLFQSFDHSANHTTDEAWATEIESRIDAYDNGKIQASPAEAIFARINGK